MEARDLITDPEGLTVIERFAFVDVDNYDFPTCRTAIDPIGPIFEIDVYAALKVTAGNMGKAAALLNRARDSLQRWLKHNQELYRVVVDAEETALDNAEELVRNQALAGDPAQLRFLLQTKGKNRGYSTRQENTGKDGADLDFARVAANRVSEDRMQQIAEEVLMRMGRMGADAQIVSGSASEV